MAWDAGPACLIVELEFSTAGGSEYNRYAGEKYSDFAQKLQDLLEVRLEEDGFRHRVLKNPGLGKSWRMDLRVPSRNYYFLAGDPLQKRCYPRPGAFEVVVHLPRGLAPAWLPQSFELWSKLRTRRWPIVQSLVDDLASLLAACRHGDKGVAECVKRLAEARGCGDTPQDLFQEAETAPDEDGAGSRSWCGRRHGASAVASAATASELGAPAASKATQQQQALPRSRSAGTIGGAGVGLDAGSAWTPGGMPLVGPIAASLRSGKAAPREEGGSAAGAFGGGAVCGAPPPRRWLPPGPPLAGLSVRLQDSPYMQAAGPPSRAQRADGAAAPLLLGRSARVAGKCGEAVVTLRPPACWAGGEARLGDGRALDTLRAALRCAERLGEVPGEDLRAARELLEALARAAAERSRTRAVIEEGRRMLAKGAPEASVETCLGSQDGRPSLRRADPLEARQEGAPSWKAASLRGTGLEALPKAVLTGQPMGDSELSGDGGDAGSAKLGDARSQPHQQRPQELQPVSPPQLLDVGEEEEEELGGQSPRTLEQVAASSKSTADAEGPEMSSPFDSFAEHMAKDGPDTGEASLAAQDAEFTWDQMLQWQPLSRLPMRSFTEEVSGPSSRCEDFTASTRWRDSTPDGENLQDAHCQDQLRSLLGALCSEGEH